MGLDWPQAWLLGLPTAVVYGSLALFTSILHNVFLLYYVDTFVSVYKINKVSFWVGEVGHAWGSCHRWEETSHQVSKQTEGAGSCPSVSPSVSPSVRLFGQAVLFSKTQPEKLILLL